MISEEEFILRFPRLFNTRALTRYEAARLNLPTDRHMFQYLSEFEFVSQAWGSIIIPTGFFTDYASVPRIFQNIYSPIGLIMLFPSAPHDWLFQKKFDGTRGWLGDQQLSLTEVNHVLVEAMQVCEATDVQCAEVFAALQLANLGIKHTFRSN